MPSAPAVRNLHLEGFRYDQPRLIALFNGLGVPVTANEDKMAIRRFLMGQLMVPIAAPVRKDVRRSICVPTCDESAANLAELHAMENESLALQLAERGIDLATLNIVEVGRYCHDGIVETEIAYMSPETDQELALRERYATMFNALLAIKDQIYASIDAGK